MKCIFFLHQNKCRPTLILLEVRIKLLYTLSLDDIVRNVRQTNNEYNKSTI